MESSFLRLEVLSKQKTKRLCVSVCEGERVVESSSSIAIITEQRPPSSGKCFVQVDVNAGTWARKRE